MHPGADGWEVHVSHSELALPAHPVDKPVVAAVCEQCEPVLAVVVYQDRLLQVTEGNKSDVGPKHASYR